MKDKLLFIDDPGFLNIILGGFDGPRGTGLNDSDLMQIHGSSFFPDSDIYAFPNTPSDLLDKVKQINPDLIVIKNNVNIKAEQVIAKLKADATTKHIFVFCLLGSDGENIKEKQTDGVSYMDAGNLTTHELRENIKKYISNVASDKS